MGEKRMKKGFDKPSSGHVCLWRKNFAADVKISTVAFLTLKSLLFHKGHFLYQGFQGKILGNFLLKRKVR